jgi:hypothetical protein
MVTRRRREVVVEEDEPNKTEKKLRAGYDWVGL